jgi:hypothetical protein
LPVDANRKRILAPDSTDSFAVHPLDQQMPRLISELDVIFSELTAYIILLFAAQLFLLFASSEVRDTIHKRHADIDTDQTAAYLAEYRPDVSRLIFLRF